MITIGERQVVFQTTLYVPDGDNARIEAKVENWDLAIEVSFKTSDEQQPNITWAGEGNLLKMSFNGYVSNIGTAMQHPGKIGVADSGNNVGFLAFVSKHGKINRLELQLLLGGKYE